MNTVKVNKAELIEIIKKNRDDHRGIFLKAQDKYREEVIKELESALGDARNGRNIRRTVTLLEPSDHTKDYDRVIRMLGLSVDDTVELSEHEFMQYVQDEWSWTGQWAHSNSLYVSHPKLGNS